MVLWCVSAPLGLDSAACGLETKLWTAGRKVASVLKDCLVATSMRSEMCWGSSFKLLPQHPCTWIAFHGMLPPAHTLHHDHYRSVHAFMHRHVHAQTTAQNVRRSP